MASVNRIWAFWLFWIATATLAQSRFQVYTLNSDNGLAQNSVYDVLQDRKGYLWISTADGINRWDGRSFDHFAHLPSDSNSLYGTNLFSFFEDPMGRLWVAHNKGLSYFNNTTNRFENPIKTDRQVLILGTNQAELLAALDGIGIMAFSIRKPHLPGKRIFAFPTSTQEIKLYYHLVRDENTAWATLNEKGDILYANLKKREFKVFRTGKSACQPLLIWDKQLIAACGSTLFLLSESNGNPELKPLCKLPNSLSLMKGYLYKERLWLGGIGGYVLVNPKTWAIEESFPQLDPLGSQQADFVYNFYTDRSDNLYISTNTQGLHILSPSRNRFQTYATPWPEYNMVKAIVKTPDGKIITGQYGSHLVVYRPGEKPKKIDFQDIKGEKVVFGLHNWSREEVLVIHPTEMRWYNHVSGKTRKLLHLSAVSTNQYPQFKVWQGRLCVNLNMGPHGAIVAFGPDEKLDTLAFFPNDMLVAWHPLSNGNLLIANLDECREYQGQKIVARQKMWVKTIQEISNGRLAIGTTTGLIITDAVGKTLKTYTSNEGLPDNFIYSVLEDQQLRLWLSHNKGLSRLDLKSGAVLSYNKTDGLPSNEFNTGAYFKANDGLLYFGGIRGLTEVNPAKLYTDRQPPQAAIRNIWVNDQILKSDTAFDELRNLSLPYDQNTLSFELAALNLSIPDRNQFAYMLKGYDKTWIAAGNQHQFRYGNIPPGAYALLVKAANADGFWGPEYTLSVQISPPFWKTYWFYGLEIFIGLFGLMMTFQLFRIQQKRKSEREMETLKKLEAERLRISRDLHDNVGAQLSYLITNLEWLADHPKTENNEWQSRLQKLGDTGREAMLTLRETIWAISSSELTFENLADRFKQYALRMAPFDGHIQLHFKEELTQEKVLSPTTALHVFRICQEAFHNALRHSGATFITISFRCGSDETYVSIRDNGHGFSPEQGQKTGHYGLRNMQNRAQEAGLNMSLHSNSTGTEMVLHL